MLYAYALRAAYGASLVAIIVYATATIMWLVLALVRDMRRDMRQEDRETADRAR